jgi:HEAT repeat protein
MSTDSDTSVNSGADAPKPTRKLQTGVRSLIALVACCAAVLWAWRHLSENYDPVLSESRSIRERAIGALGSAKPAERLGAIAGLERLDSGDNSIAIPPLIRALEDPDTEVRAASAQALSSIVPRAVKARSGGRTIRDATTALSRCLKDPQITVRIAAVKALSPIASEVVRSGSAGEIVRDVATALIAGLKDPEPSVRSAATISLSEIAQPQRASGGTSPIDRGSVRDELNAMFGDHDAEVRLAAIEAVAKHFSVSGPPEALTAVLKDDSAKIRAAAINALAHYRQGLDPWVPILFRLAEQDPDPSVREHCLRILGYAFTPPAITPAAVPALIASLKSANANVRSQAASVLGNLKARADAAIPELLRVLNEPLVPGARPFYGGGHIFDPGCASALALGRIAPGSVAAKEVVAALTEVARSGPVIRRGWAAHALGDFGPAAEEAVPALVKIIKESTPEPPTLNESSAAVALGKIAPGTPSADQAIAALLPVLESKDLFSRVRAIEALGRFGPRARAAVPKIRALEGDRESEIRKAVAKSLPAIDTGNSP